MSAANAMFRGRALAERLMIDSCTVERVTGETEGAGGVVTKQTALLYAGKCRMQVRTRERLGGSVYTAGAAYVIVSRLELQLPMDAPEVKEGDLVTITNSVYDHVLEGRTFTVRDVLVKTHQVSRRITVLEVGS